MSKPNRIDPSLGIPKNIPAELRQALAEELKKMGATYPEMMASTDLPMTPEAMLKLAKMWNSLTPEQVAAWDQAAREEDRRRGLHGSRN